MKKNFITLLMVGAGLLSSSLIEAQKRPNIIFFLADDLGFEAIGAYGGKNYKDLAPVKTPNLDRMAARGMKFTRCFATPVCSPSRAEFLTGKYNFRVGFPDIAGRNGAA
jgi:arylsulfatase A